MKVTCGSCKYHTKTNIEPMTICTLSKFKVPICYQRVETKHKMSIPADEQHECPCWEQINE